MTANRHRQDGRLGGLTSWANTVDRDARMAKIVANSPARLAYHAKKLGLDPDNLTPDEVKRCETAKRLYFARLSAKAVKATSDD